MAWVRVDDTFSDHQKVLRVGTAGVALWLEGLCYASRHLTDGYLPRHVVKKFRFVKTPLHVAESLVEATLWEKADDGYRIHDYHVYNPTAQQVREKRARDVTRKSARNPHGIHADSTRNPPLRAGAGAGVLDLDLPEREGLGERGAGFDAQPWFDRVYATYPNKTRKNAALEVWHRDVADEATARAILADVTRRLAAGWVRLERRFIPHLVTYLAEAQWEDDQQTEPEDDATVSPLPVVWECTQCGGFHEAPPGEPLTCRRHLEPARDPLVPFAELRRRYEEGKRA